MIMVVIALSMLGSIIVGFAMEWALGVGAHRFRSSGAFWCCCSLECGLEIIIIFFRIHDDTSDIARSKKM